MRLAAFSAAVFLLSACATRPVERPPVTPPVVTPAPTPTPTITWPAPPANALAAGVTFVAPMSFPQPAADSAVKAFRVSCPALLKRTDRSGLTVAADWSEPCADASRTADPAAFLRDRFDWVRIGDGKAFATGYYEPEIRGSRVRAPGYDVPIYATPASLVRCTRADGTTGRGRIDATGQCVAHFTRTEIEQGALSAETPIAWAADPIDLFFLQIQGSGRLKLPDGGVMRIGYAEQNGHSYVAVGKVLRDRGILQPGKAGMKEIVAWMRAQPDGGAALMRENPSYIFFRELTGAGPLGAMNVPVTPMVSVAADPLFVPLGAPVFLQIGATVPNVAWIAQDTGGAIKGANRFDTFWGAGSYAERMAGGLATPGSALILIPKSAGARLRAAGAHAQP